MANVCSICGEHYDGYGNNPEPVKDYHERCCDGCNKHFIIPWRMHYGRHFQPNWISFGLGKTRFELSDGRVGTVIDTGNSQVQPGAGVYKLDPKEDKAWYGRPAQEGDAIGKAVEDVLGKTKTYYGGVRAA